MVFIQTTGCVLENLICHEFYDVVDALAGDGALLRSDE